MLGQFGKEKFLILISVESVGLGGFCDAVKHCAGLRAVVMINTSFVSCANRAISETIYRGIVS